MFIGTMLRVKVTFTPLLSITGGQDTVKLIYKFYSTHQTEKYKNETSNILLSTSGVGRNHRVVLFDFLSVSAKKRNLLVVAMSLFPIRTKGIQNKSLGQSLREWSLGSRDWHNINIKQQQHSSETVCSEEPIPGFCLLLAGLASMRTYSSARAALPAHTSAVQLIVITTRQQVSLFVYSRWIWGHLGKTCLDMLKKAIKWL